VQVCNRKIRRHLRQMKVISFTRGTTATAAYNANRCVTVSSTALRHIICCFTGVAAFLSVTSSAATFVVILAATYSCEKKEHKHGGEYVGIHRSRSKQRLVFVHFKDVFSAVFRKKNALSYSDHHPFSSFPPTEETLNFKT